MRNQKKSHDLTRQNEVNVKKPQKHDANLQKNSTLYFQVGLIVCLLFSYGLLEMEFTSKKYVPDYVELIDESTDFVQKEFKIYEDPVVEVKESNATKTKLIEEVKVIDNDAAVKETPDIITTPETTTELPTQPDFSNLVDEPETTDEVPFQFVEVVPVFPGCEKASTNAERKACMSEKIAKHIRKKFDTDIASDLGLEGRQKINVMFKINQYGDVVDIKAQSPYKELEKEAIDVIGKLPKMTPGKQLNKNVSVIYGIPIKFNIQN